MGDLPNITVELLRQVYSDKDIRKRLGENVLRVLAEVEAILKQNPDVENANDIFAGQILKIPVNLVIPIPTATVGTVFPTVNVPTNTPVMTDTPTP